MATLRSYPAAIDDGADTFRIDVLGHGVDGVFDLVAGDAVEGVLGPIQGARNTKVAVDPDGLDGDSVVVFDLLGTTGLNFRPASGRVSAVDVGAVFWLAEAEAPTMSS